MTHKIISTSNQSMADSVIWFEGTLKECQETLPRIERWAAKMSDGFQIVRANEKTQSQ